MLNLKQKQRVIEIFQEMRGGGYVVPLRIELVKIWNAEKLGEVCCLSCTNQVDKVLIELKKICECE